MSQSKTINVPLFSCDILRASLGPRLIAREPVGKKVAAGSKFGNRRKQYAQKRAAGLCAEGGAPESVIALVRDQMARLTPAGLRTASSLYARANLRELLADTTIPYQFLAASADRIVPEAVVAEHGAILGRNVTLLDGVGHAAYAEDPRQFAHVVLESFRKLASA